MKSCYLPHCRLLPSFISILQGSPVVFDYWFRWRSVLPLQSALHLKHLHIWRMLSNGIQYVTSYVMTNIEVVTIAIQSLCSLICSVICVYEMCVSYALSTCLQRFSCFSPWSEDIRVTVQESGDNNLHAGNCYWCAYICLQFSICPFCIVTLVNYYTSKSEDLSISCQNTFIETVPCYLSY